MSSRVLVALRNEFDRQNQNIEVVGWSCGALDAPHALKGLLQTMLGGHFERPGGDGKSRVETMA